MAPSTFIELKVPPGVVKSRSGEGTSGRWYDAQNVRMVDGKPAKRAGFRRITDEVLIGRARGMEAWNTLKGEPLYAVGTHLKLYGAQDGITPADITPLRHPDSVNNALSTTTGKGAVTLEWEGTEGGTLPNNPFTTVNADATVTVNHPDHGKDTGAKVFYASATAINGVTLNGLYEITKTSDDAYTVEASANATGAGAGGGAAVTYKWPELADGDLFVFFKGAHNGGDFGAGVILDGEWEIVEASGDRFKLYPTDAKGDFGPDPFTTENGKPTVTVALTDHGRETGDAVWIEGAAAAGGLTPKGEYKITVVDDDSFTITMGSNASSTATGGGSGATYHFAKAAVATVLDGGGTVYYERYLTDPFATVDTSSTVTVTRKGHGAKANAIVHISGATTVGGIELDGAHPVTAVIDEDTFTITADTAATSSETGGSSVLLTFEINPGPQDQVFARRAYGSRNYGRGPYGKPRLTDAPIYYKPRTWSLDNIGEDLIASPLGGSIYYWDSSEGGRATRIPGAPDELLYVCMTEERHLHALGMNGDPMVFGWADREDITLWKEASTNTANPSRRVREGSSLVAMAPVANGVNLIWTDSAVYRHQFTGGQFIYETTIEARNAGLISPQAFAVTNLGVVWYGATGGFQMWNGVHQPAPNATDIEDWLRSQIDPDEAYKCFAGYDPVNNSVDFYFIRKGEGEPGLLIILDLKTFTWTPMVETRTTGAIFKQGLQTPHRVGANGRIYQHEFGRDADGLDAPSHITLAPMEMAKGKWVEITGLDPDFRSQVGAMEVTINTYDRNQSNPVETETETVPEGVEMVDLRCAGRRFSMTLSQSGVGTDWSLDTPQIEVRQSGARR